MMQHPSFNDYLVAFAPLVAFGLMLLIVRVMS